MKKWIFLIVLILTPMLLLAQDPDIPGSIGEILDDPGRFFKALAGVAGLTIFLAANIIRWMKPEKKWIKLVIGWVCAILVALFSNVANFGLFAELPYVDTLIWGMGLGFVAGSIVDIPTMKILVELILSIIRLKRPA